MMIRFLFIPFLSFLCVCVRGFDQLNLENNVMYIDDIEIYYLAIIKSHEMCSVRALYKKAELSLVCL